MSVQSFEAPVSKFKTILLSSHTVHLYVVYRSQNKEWLFPHTVFCTEWINGEVNISHENTTMVVGFMMVFNSKKYNYMFRPIAAIFRFLQFCSKCVIYIYICMPILRGNAEISSLLRVTVSLPTYIVPVIDR